MTPNQPYSWHLRFLEEFLRETYDDLNWQDDMALRNKLEELAFMLAKRTNDPTPKKPEDRPQEAEVDRGFH